MVKKPQVLAIIPARGGSKGIPRKNIRRFAGYPLIAYSIAAAVQAQSVTRVIVSTDDSEIASIARDYGAETPFLRPIEIAQDNTLDLPVYQHALQWMDEHEQYKPDVVVQLRPTSPVRPRSCVDDAVRMLLDRPDADSVRGVVPAGQNPHKMWRIETVSGQMHPLLSVEGVSEPYNAPRQVLPLVYWQTGHIDAIRPEVIIKKNSMSGSVILPLLIDPRFTIDIDNPFDWVSAEWMVYHGGLDMVNPGQRRRPIPEQVRMIVFDFDGVMTDNHVWVNENGHEMVSANRSDGLRMNEIRNAGIQMVVLSTESNPVVAARCKKLKVEVLQGIPDKALVLKELLADRGIDPHSVIYLGNDINDIACFPLVGCAIVTADAEPAALRMADVVLTRKGGQGVVRELCDLILEKYHPKE